MGRLYGWIATAAFLAMDGPLALVRSLAESYTVIPAGGQVLSRDSARARLRPGRACPGAGAASGRSSGDRAW